MKKYFRNFIFFLSIVALGMACDNSSGSEDGEPAMIEGRVENTSSSSSDTTDSAQTRFKTVEGAAVTVTRIQADGSLETISDSATVTDAEGEFTLAVSANAVSNGSNQFIVMAENEGETAKTFVTSEVESGVTVLVQPITYESSAEADVYQQLIAADNTEPVEKADIETFVNAKVAVDLENDSTLASEVAAGLSARAATIAEFYNALEVDVSEEQRDEIQQIKLDAQTKLENRLHALSGEQGAVGIFEDFIETVAQAEIEAGINATAAAKASEGSSHILLNQTSELSAEAQAEVRQQAALMLTFPLSEGVQKQLEFAGASRSAVNSAGDAAATLRINIRAINSPSEEEISAAFKGYNQEIVSIIQNEFNINGELFAAANAEINKSGGAKLTLESTLDGTVAVPSVIDAYMEFYANAESIINSTFESATEAELRRYFTQLLILINLDS